MYNSKYMRNPFANLFKVSNTKTKDASLITGSTFTGFDHMSDSLNLNTFKDSLYLYIAVSKIAKRASGVPLELHKIKNNDGDTEEVFQHPILDLFYNPNEIQTQKEFMEVSFAHYLLSGDVFWYIDRKDNSMVTLRPDKVEILLSADKKRVVAYEYRNTEVTKFAPEDIVHIKNPDPTDLLRGVGAIRPASVRIVTEREAGNYQANFFKNQGRPDVAVFVDRPVSNDEGNEARARWKSIFGRGNGGQAGFFGSDIKDIKDLNVTPKEMDFIKSQNFLRDDILASLGVPKAMVTSDDVNMANAKESYRMFLQEAVIPVLDAFVDVINNRLIPKFDENVFFRFDDPTPSDRDMLLKEHQAGVGKWITQNEARIETGRPAMEGFDELGSVSFTNNYQQLQEEAKHVIRRRPLLAKRLKAEELTAQALLATSTEPKREMNSVFPTASSKNAYAKAFNDRVDRKAETIKEAIDRYHAEQLKRVLATDLQPVGFMDRNEEKSLAKDFFNPIMAKLYNDGGQQALDALFKKGLDTFFSDEVLLMAIASRVEFFTDSIVETSFSIIKDKIVSGLSAGDGVEKIGRDIRSYYDDMSVSRARTIAQTETNFTLSKATNDAYSQSSVVTGKEWLTVGDLNVRPEHVANDGVKIAKGGTFPNGESHPGQSSINCRCVLLPLV